MLTRKKVAAIGVLLLAIALAVSLPLLLRQMQLNAGPQNSIKVAYAGAPLEALTFIAKDYGFFSQEGVSVELDQVIPTLALPGLLAGQYQISMFASPNLVSFMSRGVPVVIIAHGLYIPKNPQGVTMDGIIVRKGLGITSPKDLEGKVVGVSAFGSVLDIDFRMFVKNNNIDLSQIQYQEIPPAQVGSLMEAGKLDAYMASQPQIVSLVSAGVAIVYTYNNWVPENYFSSTYTTSKSFLENNPNLLSRFVLALQKAASFMSQNSTAYYQTVSKYTKVSADLLREFPIPVPVGGNTLSIDMSILRGTETVQLQMGLISSEVDFSKFVDGRFVGLTQ